MNITIINSKVKGVLNAPTSKSYAQRAVAIAALTKGVTKITNFGFCDDTKAAIGVAKSLGAEVSIGEDRIATICSRGVELKSGELNIGESGLSTRLFTPVASLLPTPITINGHGSILSRPIDMMEEPLRSLGVEVSTNSGKLPIVVKGPMSGGEIEIDGSLSSQFLTGLLISLPLVANDSVINVVDLKSRPYIDMTLEVMRAFGVEVVNDNYERFVIRGNQQYAANTTYNIEGDWSGASTLLVAGATAGEVTINNLNVKSQQADRAILDALEWCGANVLLSPIGVTVSKGDSLKGFEFDATECPDLFPALAALAACCDGDSVIVGTRRLTHKESDRAKTLQDVYASLGIEIDLSTDNVMKITGGTIQGGAVDSYNDHRIAMCAAVSALSALSPVEIINSECINKSYSEFYDDLHSIMVG